LLKIGSDIKRIYISFSCIKNKIDKQTNNKKRVFFLNKLIFFASEHGQKVVLTAENNLIFVSVPVQA